MSLLHWKDEYSVGIDAVDHEHKELIELINRLYQELDAVDAEHTVPAFFGDLLKGISAHFALEEKFVAANKAELEAFKAAAEQSK